MKQPVIILLIAISFFSCNSLSNKGKEKGDTSVKEAKAEMAFETANAKNDYTDIYEKAVKQSNDTAAVRKLTLLNVSLQTTTKYIDSLISEMNKIDDQGLKSAVLIKEMFLENGVGDSVFYKVKTSYCFIEDIAHNDTTKLAIQAVHNSYTEDSKIQFFKLNNPLGVNMVLYGIQSGLIKDASKGLQDYLSIK